MDRNYDIIISISKFVFERRLRVANFAGITKIATMLIKKTFKDSNKVKRIRRNAIYICIKVADLR